MSYNKTILGQIFGARKLNTNEDNENMLGYELYSAALADMLSEPSLSVPITVGLYARWGSGKSFLLSKLKGKCYFYFLGLMRTISYFICRQRVANAPQSRIFQLRKIEMYRDVVCTTCDCIFDIVTTDCPCPYFTFFYCL